MAPEATGRSTTHHSMGPGCIPLLASHHLCPGCGMPWTPGMINDHPESAALPLPPPARSMQVIDIKGLDPVEYFFDALLKGRVYVEPVQVHADYGGVQYRIQVDPEPDGG